MHKQPWCSVLLQSEETQLQNEKRCPLSNTLRSEGGSGVQASPPLVSLLPVWFTLVLAWPIPVASDFVYVLLGTSPPFTLILPGPFSVAVEVRYLSPNVFPNSSHQTHSHFVSSSILSFSSLLQTPIATWSNLFKNVFRCGLLVSSLKVEERWAGLWRNQIRNQKV